MQRFSACRKRSPEIHRFSSTSTRCITAICPADPPNEFNPMYRNTRAISAKLTPCAGNPDSETGPDITEDPTGESDGLRLRRLWRVRHGLRRRDSRRLCASARTLSKTSRPYLFFNHVSVTSLTPRAWPRISAFTTQPATTVSFTPYFSARMSAKSSGGGRRRPKVSITGFLEAIARSASAFPRS